MSRSDLLGQLPSPQSVKLVNFEQAEVVPGLLPNTYFLIVHGTKPCTNMRIELIPITYVRCPEYWGIEVVGYIPDGHSQNTNSPYMVTISLSGITGSDGIEVFGANKKQQHKVKGGCGKA